MAQSESSAAIELSPSANDRGIGGRGRKRKLGRRSHNGDTLPQQTLCLYEAKLAPLGLYNKEYWIIPRNLPTLLVQSEDTLLLD